ncbi:MAG TPA: hypothetical protein VGJ26_15235, partial [Pirellulales bacterium]
MLVRGSTKFHHEFDLEEARRQFAGMSKTLSGEQVTSPWDLYAVEALRDRHQLRIGESYPADVFVFGKGEPGDP